VIVGDHHKGNTQASEVEHDVRRIIMVGFETCKYIINVNRNNIFEILTNLYNCFY